VKLSPGELIDQKYQIVRVLGTGGMGSVYEAMNLRVGRRVAIKVMHKVRDQGDIARFEREARAAQIGSPYIVQVHDLGYLSDGAPYMVMEYLAGESLGERMHRQGRLRPSELIPITKQVLEALAAAHRAGIVHRDLKPDNVFLSRPEGDDREVVKLVDFGISKILSSSSQNQSPGGALSLTKTGVAVGTPQYMSPEQVQGKKELDGRSDLYSLGVMLYRCFSGQLPFNAEEIAPLLMQILVDVPRSLREAVPELDRELVTLVTRAMARRPEDRFQTAGEFLTALVAWEQTHAADLDAPLVPVGMTAVTRTGQHGTAASWSRVTEASTPSGSRIRTLALTVSLLVAGVVGVLVAVKLWTTPRAPAGLVSTSATALANALPANAGQVPPPDVTPVTAIPAAPPVSPMVARSGRSGAVPPGVEVPVAVPAAAPAEVTPVPNPTPSAGPSALPVVVSPVPVTSAPANPPVPAKGHSTSDAEDPSNRHVLGDL
jgi:serine/threonine-protein kinase